MGYLSTLALCLPVGVGGAFFVQFLEAVLEWAGGAMRVWLVGFVLLFVGVELFEWVAQLEIAQDGGYWVVLGGLGLAAASNAKHLPGLSGKQTKQIETPEEPVVSEKLEKGVDRSDDSISFRGRSPWR